MSIVQLAAVWYVDTLAPNQRLIALAMADHADDAGRCWPSMQRLADKTGYSRRQTSRLVKELRELGYVEIVEEATPRFTPLYQLHPHKLGSSVTLHMQRQGHDHPTFDDVLRRDPGYDPGATNETGEVTPSTSGDDTGDISEATPMSPEPSENHQDPSPEPSLEEPGAEIERFVDDTSDMVPTPAPRPRNLGFDALVHVFGYTPEGPEAALFGRIAAKANREDDPVSAVLERATRMISQWGAKTLTPAALDKWWQRFGSPLGAATEEEAARLRDDFEAAERRRRAEALDAESAGLATVVDLPSVEMSTEEAREYVLDAVTELDEEEEPHGNRG